MEWPIPVIKEHILTHMNDPAIEMGEQIKTHKHLIKMLKNKVTIKNPSTGEMKHDLKVIEKIIQLNKAVREIYNSKPEKSLFHDRNLKIGVQE